MDVVVAQQGLAPGMQDGKESDLCAETAFRISSHFEQGLGTGGEEQIEKVAWEKSVPAGSVRAPR